MDGEMDKLYENNYVSKESNSFVQHALGYTENWEVSEVFEGAAFADDGINCIFVCSKIQYPESGTDD